MAWINQTIHAALLEVETGSYCSSKLKIASNYPPFLTGMYCFVPYFYSILYALYRI